MDNKEFAKVLLCEASELLAESAGRNGAGDRYREAKLKNMKKEMAELRAKANDGKLTEKEEERLDDLRYAASYVNGWDGSKSHSSPGPKFFGDAYARKASPASINHGNISLGKDAAKISKQIADGKGGTRVDYIKPSGSYTYTDVDKYDRSDRKVNPIHEKINNRAKKSQNESIAVLLTEAALLLNEED